MLRPSFRRSFVPALVPSFGILGKLDPLAAAAIENLEIDGASVTPKQEGGIERFFKTAQTVGWLPKVPRLYLPIWELEAPNERCLVSGVSAAFRPTVTYGDGFVQGDGISGDMLSDLSPAGANHSDSNGGLFALCIQAPTGTGFSAMGGLSGPNQSVQLFFSGNNVPGSVTGTPLLSFAGTRATNTGIWLTSRTSPTILSLYRRTASGFSLADSEAGSVAGNSPIVAPLTFLSQGGAIKSDGRYGAYGILEGMTSDEARSFTAALKDLWETCTGLALP